MTQINYMVVGIGINVNLDREDIPKDINDKASSLKIETGENVSRKELVARVLNNFEYFYDVFINEGSIREVIEICKDRSILLGKTVRLIEKKHELKRKAVDITDEGELIVEDESGNRTVVISGEVSVRGEHGYV